MNPQNEPWFNPKICQFAFEQVGLNGVKHTASQQTSSSKDCDAVQALRLYVYELAGK